MGKTLCKQYYACRFDYRIHNATNLHIYMEYEFNCLKRILWIEFYACKTIYVIQCIEQYACKTMEIL